MAMQAYEMEIEVVPDDGRWKWTVTQCWNPPSTIGNHELGSGHAATEDQAYADASEYEQDWYSDRPEFYR